MTKYNHFFNITQSLNSNFSGTTGPIFTKLGMQHLWSKVNKTARFHSQPPPPFLMKSLKIFTHRHFMEKLNCCIVTMRVYLNHDDTCDP